MSLKNLLRNKRKGFSLAEVLVATLLIAVVSVTTLQFFIFVQRNFIVKTKSKFEAANVAKETMENNYWSSTLTDGTTPLTLPANSYCGLISTAAYNEVVATQSAVQIGAVYYDAKYNYKILTVTIQDWN